MSKLFFRYGRPSWWQLGRKYVEMSVKNSNHAYQKWMYTRKANNIHAYVKLTYRGVTRLDAHKESVALTKNDGMPF